MQGQPALSLTVPTNSPGDTEIEFTTKGWIVGNLYAGKFYPTICDGHLWAIQFWRPAQDELALGEK